MHEIKKIGALSAGKFMGILYAIIGLVIGIIITLVSIVGSSIGADIGGGFWLFGIFSFIGFPIGYGIMGFISGIVAAGGYNMVASWIGGIEIEIE